MLPAHKNVIRTNYNKLRESIKDNIGLVCRDLFSAKVISKAMMEKILQNYNNDADRTMALLDLLPTRGPYAFEQLYKSCVAKELHGAADALKPHLPSHFKTSRVDNPPGNHNADDDLPDSWPSGDIITNGTEVRKVNKEDVEIIEFYNYSLTPEGQKKYYAMKNRIKGRVLVINNEKFLKLGRREGTGKDRQSIESVFAEQGLGFDIEVRSNKTGEEMLTILKNEAAADHSQFDCFILFVLSHGEDGVVFGTDGYTQDKIHYNYVSISDIRKMFCSVPTLIGKPKIFFIQACQGASEDKGFFNNPADRPVDVLPRQSSSSNPGPIIETEPMDVTVSPGPASASSSYTQATPVDGVDSQRARAAELTEVVPVTQESPDGDIDLRQTIRVLSIAFDADLEQNDAYGEKTPSLADAFIAMATTPGNLSWRNTKYGTWFIQAITFVFAKFAYKYDIQTLMTMVNSLVSKAETIKEKNKQVAEKRDTLTKSLYLFPGLPGDNS